MSLCRIWMRPWLCTKCGGIQIQTELMGNPGNCNRFNCSQDDPLRAGPWRIGDVEIFRGVFIGDKIDKTVLVAQPAQRGR
jgi:hypothetical protein